MRTVTCLCLANLIGLNIALTCLATDRLKRQNTADYYVIGHIGQHAFKSTDIYLFFFSILKRPSIALIPLV